LKGSRFFGDRRSLKSVQSGHHDSGLKPDVPAIGSTSRCMQHSVPSSGGRRQRHERNFITAADVSDVAASAAPAGISGTGKSVGSLLKLDANRLLQCAQRTKFFGCHQRERGAFGEVASGAADAMHVGFR
jgi:hypothetical protein